MNLRLNGLSSPSRAFICALALAAGALCRISAAHASLDAPLAPATSEGTYTVTLQDCFDSMTSLFCAGQWLEERTEPDGEFAATSGEYTGKAEGVYTYRTAAVYCDTYYATCFTQYSTTVSVTVGLDLPLIDKLEDQLKYRYRVRVANVVGDSGTDILVERIKSGEPGNGVIDAIILEQRPGKVFAAIVPDSSQRTSTAWMSSRIQVALADINVDGFADVVLRNVERSITGAPDQIIFSPGQLLVERPKSIRAVDDALEVYASNMLDYIFDASYFADSAPLDLYATVYSSFSCSWVAGSALYDSYSYNGTGCGWQPSAIFVIAKNYSGFSTEAVSIWRDEMAIDDGVITRTQGVDAILKAAEHALEIPIGGWEMGDFLPPLSQIDRIDYRKGLEAFLSMLGLGNAEESEGEIAPRQVAREPDEVYIVGRHVFGQGVNRLHTALLYQATTRALPAWISAFDSDLSTLGDGTLVARTNDKRDTPILMRFTIGTVTPPQFESPGAYFTTDLMSAHNYYRKLPNGEKAPYDAIPELPWCPWCKGRNSNGYVSGIIAATGGHPQVEMGSEYADLSALTGWEYPVEPSYFGR